MVRSVNKIWSRLQTINHAYFWPDIPIIFKNQTNVSVHYSSYGRKNLMQALSVELITLININYLKEK